MTFRSWIKLAVGTLAIAVIMMVTVEFPVIRPIAGAMWQIHLTTEAEGAFNPSNVLFSPNIATMQALGTASPIYPTLQVLGYTTAGDGGGGLFYWNSSSTATVDSGTIFTANGVTTGRWLRQYVGSLHTLWFGAITTGLTDTHAAVQACDSAAYNSNTTYNRCYFDPGAYAISSHLTKCASWDAADNNGVVIEPLSGYTDPGLVNMLGCGSGGWGYFNNIILTVAPLGATTTVRNLYSTSSGGGGGIAGTQFNNDTFISDATGAYTLTMVSSLNEQGALTGTTFNNVRIIGPCPVYIGNLQNEIVFNNLRINQSGGCTVVPEIWAGEDIVRNSTYDSLAAPAAAGTCNVQYLFNIIDNNPFYEVNPQSNQPLCIGDGTNWAFPTISGLHTNFAAYTGSAGANAALFRLNLTTSAGAYSAEGVNLINGYLNTPNSVPPYPRLFSVVEPGSGAYNNFVINMQGAGWRLWSSGSAGFAKTNSISTTNTNNVLLLEGGPDNSSYGLFQSPAPPAGTSLTWTALVNTTWSN